MHRVEMQVVEEDEFETNGAYGQPQFWPYRASRHLRFLTALVPLLHGEAIAVGMVTEARLAKNLGVTREGAAD